MASTADCKTLLSQHDALQGLSGWKRLSKRNAPDGVERVFASGDGSHFVRMLENDGGLAVDKIGASMAEVSGMATSNTHVTSDPGSGLREGEMLYPVNLFALFPPDMGTTNEELAESAADGDYPFCNPETFEAMDTAGMDLRQVLRQCFTGRLIYSFEDGEQSQDEFNFMFGFETSDGFMDDQHRQATESILTVLLADRLDALSINDAESFHSLEPRGKPPRAIKAELIAIFEANGAGKFGGKNKIEARLPADAAVFAARPVSHEEVAVSIIEASGQDGKQLLTGQWGHLTGRTQLALQRWAVANNARLNAVEPDSAAAEILNVENASGSDGWFLAEDGRLANAARVAEFLAGSPLSPAELEEAARSPRRPGV